MRFPLPSWGNLSANMASKADIARGKTVPGSVFNTSNL
jgi:hypothetical protein